MGKPVDQPRTDVMTRLGSYEIVRKLARGGMAELFLARTVGPEGFEKVVVLKKILPNHAENPKFVRLFLDEAKLAATLDHPYIAAVYDMGKVDGNYFFTMEYIHGQDVRSTLRRTTRKEQKFPIDHAVQIARNIAAALHYAHERRRADGTLLDIVHRDVSPSNILISYDGASKLVDFGVAKAATSSVKTRTGTLKGKISYMSPEQAKGSPIDRRSDIFSLGIVLWELVCTKRLFKADNDLATIQMIVNTVPPPPTRFREDCPPELERIIMRALAQEPADRYQTAEQMQLDLEELAREHKLKQSPVALRAFMNELFSEEIKAWSIAQASGQTLTDHVLGAQSQSQPGEMTTPVSESELEYLDEPDDEEVADSEQATAALLEKSGVATKQIPDEPMHAVLSKPGPSVIVRDQTPPPVRVPRANPTPTATVTPLPAITTKPEVDDATYIGDVVMRRKTKQLLLGGVGGLLLLIVIIALAFGGGGDKKRTSAKTADEPAPSAPATKSPAPAPTPAPTPAPAAAPEPTEAAATTPEPAATEASSTATAKPTESAKPSAPTAATTTTTTTKATSTTKPTTTKATKKPTTPTTKKKTWDPNSALPPP